MISYHKILLCENYDHWKEHKYEAKIVEIKDSEINFNESLFFSFFFFIDEDDHDYLAQKKKKTMTNGDYYFLPY